MGFYIETNDSKNKADYLIKNYQAVEKLNPAWPPPENKCWICVIDNRMFEAAGICYDEDEFLEFNDPFDLRDKRWLLMDKDKVIKLNPRVERML